MTLRLEGNIAYEHTPTRRWVTIVAVVIPVAAFVMLAAWFIRAFIEPPTVAVSGPMLVASAPPPPPAVPKRPQIAAPAQQQFPQQAELQPAPPSSGAPKTEAPGQVPMM